MQSGRPQDNPSSDLQRQYTLALGVVACLCVTTHFLLQEALRLQQCETFIVDAVCSQQLQMARLSRAAVTLKHAGGGEAIERAAAGFAAELKQWSTSCRTLEQRLREGAVRSRIGNSLESNDLVFHFLDDDGQQLLASVHAASEPAVKNQEIGRITDRLIQDEADLQVQINRLLTVVQGHIEYRRQWLSWTGLAIVSIILVLLLMQGVLVFGKALKLVAHFRNEEKRVAEKADQARHVLVESLRETGAQAKKLHLVAEHTNNLVIISDTDGRIEWVNESFRKVTGFSLKCAVGKTLGHLLCDTRTNRAAIDAIYDQLKHGRAVKTEVTLFSREGRQHWLAVDGQRCFDVQGELSSLIVIAMDITQQKQATQALQELSRRHESIVNSAAEGICGIDADGRIVLANPAAVRMLGTTASELLGREHHEAFHHGRRDDEAIQRTDCPICQAFDSRQDFHADRWFFRLRDRSRLPVECSLVSIREDGQWTGAVLTFTDITQREFLQRQLLQSQKLESIGQLAAGIAHELNTPIQYVRDNVHFLKDSFGELTAHCRARSESGDDQPTGSPDIQFALDEIPSAISESLDGIERVIKIVRAMKDFSHPGQEQRAASDLNRAIESTITVAKGEWKYVADVVTDLDPSLPPVPCLQGELNQVVLNLLINAAHAIGDVVGSNAANKGTITVSTRYLGTEAEIRIADTGTGIPAEHRSRLFDPFFTTKPIGKGTGQGLALAYRIVVEQHHGTIDFETEPGQGTTFIIRLPMATDTSDEGAPDEAAYSVC